MGNSDSRRKLWLQRELDGLCIYCGKNEAIQDRKGCEKCLARKVDITIKFSQNNKQSISQYRLLIKYQVLEKYGNICACCGEEEKLFLTIDHVNNDGYQDRINQYGIKNPPSSSWYLKLRRDPIREDLQVLCFNCNFGKSINGGICPHQFVNRVLSPSYDKRHDSQFDFRLKIIWPSDDELIDKCNQTSIAQVARELGVDFAAVSGRLDRRGKYHLVQKKTGGVKPGETNAAAKLTLDLVKEIRNKCSAGIARKLLAQEYGVSKSTIDKIINNQIWKK